MGSRDDDPTLAPLQMLLKLDEMARRALEVLPAKATRHRTASFYPLELVDRALVHGWGMTYNTSNEDGAPRRRRGKGVAYVFTPRASQDSPFANVASICYGAFGWSDGVSERALKAFIASRQASSKV